MIGFFQRNDVERINILGDVLLVVDDDHVFPNENEIWMGNGKFAPIAKMQNKWTKRSMHLLAEHLQIQHERMMMLARSEVNPAGGRD